MIICYQLSLPNRQKMENSELMLVDASNSVKSPHAQLCSQGQN